MKKLILIFILLGAIKSNGQSKKDSSVHLNQVTGSGMYYTSFYTDMMPDVMLGVKYDDKNRIVDTVIRLINCDSITAIKLIWNQYQKVINKKDKEKSELLKEYQKVVREYNKLYDAYSYQRKISQQLIKDVDAQLENIKKKIK